MSAELTAIRSHDAHAGGDLCRPPSRPGTETNSAVSAARATSQPPRNARPLGRGRGVCKTSTAGMIDSGEKAITRASEKRPVSSDVQLPDTDSTVTRRLEAKLPFAVLFGEAHLGVPGSAIHCAGDRGGGLITVDLNGFDGDRSVRLACAGRLQVRMRLAHLVDYLLHLGAPQPAKRRHVGAGGGCRLADQRPDLLIVRLGFGRADRRNQCDGDGHRREDGDDAAHDPHHPVSPAHTGWWGPPSGRAGNPVRRGRGRRRPCRGLLPIRLGRVRALRRVGPLRWVGSLRHWRRPLRRWSLRWHRRRVARHSDHFAALPAFRREGPYRRRAEVARLERNRLNLDGVEHRDKHFYSYRMEVSWTLLTRQPRLRRRRPRRYRRHRPPATPRSGPLIC